MKMQRRWLLQPILILTFVAMAPSKTYAQTEFVYTNDNQSNNLPNTVSAFSVGHNGQLRLLEGSPYPTGGFGTYGASYVFINNTIQVRGKFLFVSNYDSVSVFAIDTHSGSLSLIPGSPFHIAGPISGFGIALAVAPDQRFLFAGDESETAISVFTIAANGSLALLPGSPFDIGGQPTDMKVTPGTKFLIVSLSARIGVYRIFTSGRFAPIAGSPFPFHVLGIDVNCNASLLFTGTINAEAGVLHIAANGFLDPIPGSPFMGPGMEYLAVALNSAENFLYVADYPGAVVTFSVAHDGRLTVVPDSPFPVTGQISGLIPDEDDKFLFVAAEGHSGGEVISFAAGPHGYLSMVPGSPFLTGEYGSLTSLATFPGKNCS